MTPDAMYAPSMVPLSEQIRQMLASYLAQPAAFSQIPAYGAYGITPAQLGLFGGNVYQQGYALPDILSSLFAGAQGQRPAAYATAGGGGQASPMGGGSYSMPAQAATPAGIPPLGTGGNTPWTAAAYGGAAPTPGTATPQELGLFGGDVNGPGPLMGWTGDRPIYQPPIQDVNHAGENREGQMMADMDSGMHTQDYMGGLINVDNSGNFVSWNTKPEDVNLGYYESRDNSPGYQSPDYS